MFCPDSDFDICRNDAPQWDVPYLGCNDVFVQRSLTIDNDVLYLDGYYIGHFVGVEGNCLKFRNQWNESEATINVDPDILDKYKMKLEK